MLKDFPASERRKPWGAVGQVGTLVAHHLALAFHPEVGIHNPLAVAASPCSVGPCLEGIVVASDQGDT